MHRVCLVFGRFCLLAVVSLQSGCITVNLIEPSGPVQEVQLSGTGDGKVLLLDLSGVISSQDKDGLVPQPNMLAMFREELTRAAKDDKIKAVVVRINSPGGTVTASDILYHELRDFKTKRKVPVIASMMDVAASGGYYLAMAADSILASDRLLQTRKSISVSSTSTNHSGSHFLRRRVLKSESSITNDYSSCTVIPNLRKRRSSDVCSLMHV